MSNSTFACPLPFLNAEDYSGGFTAGRFCSTESGLSCCLPCPSTDWVYGDHFNAVTRSIEWVNVVGMACTIFLLASFAFVPVEKTHRHYLSICLAVAVGVMQMGFIVPLGREPDRCFDEITPNDMHTSTTCAISGALVLAGGWSAILWVFLRSLALHLQICWQRVIGKTFMYGALVAGWGIPAIALTIAMIVSGVSFRFGDTCHINHDGSLYDFWIPLLVFAGFTVVIQFVTFGYCIRVYLASLSDKESSTVSSSGQLPSYSNSVQTTLSPRQAYRRVRRVIELQWRGIAVVLLIVIDVAFFAVIFVFMDNASVVLEDDPAKAAPWLICLIKSQGDKNKCLPLASTLFVNEATVIAVLLLLSMNGIWAGIFLGRFSMFIGWWEIIRGHIIKPSNEFVSADARLSKDPRTYEMLDREASLRKIPTHTMSPLSPLSPVSPTLRHGRENSDYFDSEAKYKSPHGSFSSPRPPQSWDASETYAPPTTYVTAGTYIDPLGMNKI